MEKNIKKLTTEQFVEIGETLENVGTITGLEIAWPLGKNIQSIRPKMKEIAKQRDTLRESFLERHPDGRAVTVQDGNQMRYKFTDEAKFTKALNELGETEMEFAFHEIARENYPETVWAKIKPGNLATLMGYVIVENTLRKV